MLAKGIASRQRPRVGILHWTFHPTTGGTESHIDDMARLLAERGIAVTVITGEPRPRIPTGCAVAITPLLNLEALRARVLDGASTEREFAYWLSEVIRVHRLDLVHGHNLHHFFAHPALVLDQLRTRCGLRIHHTFHETWPNILTDRPVYRAWDGNYAISEHVQHECESRLGFRPLLLRNAVDTRWFSATTTPFAHDGPPVILHPARLLPWKGVHLSIEMLDRLRQRGIVARLVLTDTQRIADWDRELVSYREAIIKDIRDRGLEAEVTLTPVAYPMMPALYAACDVVVYPTVGEEPFGLVPLEAMSAGRPVVGSRSGGIPESIRDGVTGYLVERGNVEELTDAVASLLRNPHRAAEMGKAGQGLVESEFNMDRYVDRLLGYYQATIR